MLSFKHKLEHKVIELQCTVAQFSKTSLLSGLYESVFGEPTAKITKRLGLCFPISLISKPVIAR